MASLKNKIEVYLERSFTPREIDLVSVDGKPTITYWSDTIEKSKPTEEQLNALDSQADTLQNNKASIDARLNEYPSIGDMIDAICKKEAGDSTEFDSLETKRQEIKSKYPKESS